MQSTTNRGESMNHKLAKSTRIIIIFNVLILIAAMMFHGHNVYKIKITNDTIHAKMAEEKVIRDTAIRMLKRDGVELFLGDEFATFSSLILIVVTLILLFKYSKTNLFFFGFGSAFFSLLTTFVGGLLLFYIILSGKSETGENMKDIWIQKDYWEKYIHNKSVETDS